MNFRIIATFVIFLFSMRVNAQTVMPSEPLSKALTIFELPPFERAVCCIRYYEGLHRKKDYPYVGYGHKLRPGERYSSEMTASEAEALLRKDLKELCSLFRPYGKDSLLLAALAYNIGAFKLLGLDGKYPKSIILKKLDSGDRNIKNDYVKYCHWRGGVARRLLPSSDDDMLNFCCYSIHEYVIPLVKCICILPVKFIFNNKTILGLFGIAIFMYNSLLSLIQCIPLCSSRS